MPYITQERRDAIWDDLGEIETPGELNYVLTIVGLRWIESDNDDPARLNIAYKFAVAQYIANKGGPSYTVFNDAIGALFCSGLELFRRTKASNKKELDVLTTLQKVSESFYDEVVGPYEDRKIEENGDVYQL